MNDIDIIVDLGRKRAKAKIATQMMKMMKLVIMQVKFHRMLHRNHRPNQRRKVKKGNKMMMIGRIVKVKVK